MSKPKHRRCQTCHQVTARYLRSQNAGGFTVKMWATDPDRGEVQLVNGTQTYCRDHAPQSVNA